MADDCNNRKQCSSPPNKGGVRGYSNLPIRRVKGARNKSPILSYGFIVMTIDTGKLLAVKRRFSPGYTVLLLGKYRTGNIADIISNMTKPEYDNIQRLYANDFKDLHSIMKDISRNTITFEDVSYVKKRLIDDRHVIESNIDRITSNELEWGWPKGRKKNKTENDRICAEREVEEETGLKLTSEVTYFISNKTLRESFIGFNGLSYIGNFYMALVKNEHELKANDTYEIGSCGWISYEALKKSMANARMRLLDSAYQILSQERAKIMNKTFSIDVSGQTYREVVSHGLNQFSVNIANDLVILPPPGFDKPCEDWNKNEWHKNLIRKKNQASGVFDSTYKTQTLEYGITSI
jgi:8-oxo-dGTP pyrophosphatase MutT (NUDIX family)